MIRFSRFKINSFFFTFPSLFLFYVYFGIDVQFECARS